MIGGRLNLYTNLLNKFDGVFIGSGLNDSEWKNVFVSINSSHIVLSATDEQSIYPITSDGLEPLPTARNNNPSSFTSTRLGGQSSYLRKSPSFVGCMEDVVVNGKWLLPTDEHMTAATFGHENASEGHVTVILNEEGRRSFRFVISVSMFVRTRQPHGSVFHLGPSLGGTAEPADETVIAAYLEGGELVVVRNNTLVEVRINGTEYFKKTISSAGPLHAQVLYLGGMPPRPAASAPLMLQPTTGSAEVEAMTPAGLPGATVLRRTRRQIAAVAASQTVANGVIDETHRNTSSVLVHPDIAVTRVKRTSMNVWNTTTRARTTPHVWTVSLTTHVSVHLDSRAGSKYKHASVQISVVHTDGSYEGVRCEKDVDECEQATLAGVEPCGAGVCENQPGTFICRCQNDSFCGLTCSEPNPCLDEPCQNEASCTPVCTTDQNYTCECPLGFAGHNCDVFVDLSAREDDDGPNLALIITPIVCLLVLIAAVGLAVFLSLARKKRATRGTYSPSQQEYCNPRVELDNVLKPPPEERLI
ncbi:hypothetical protein B566_EDAN004145 [Ephemera danica]|nr:hypothetical protein B566_EDAN004145 [Ephemera danica]